MDSKLLNKIYAMYHRELYLYIYSLCRNREIAEDILQETFLKAILSLSAKHGNIRAWLYMVARNLYINLYNKEKKKTDLEAFWKMPVTEADLTENMIAKERNRLLYEALQILPQMKREVVVLQYFGGFSQKEIAAILHISPENVRVLGYRAKKEIKKYMEAKGYDI